MQEQKKLSEKELSYTFWLVVITVHVLTSVFRTLGILFDLLSHAHLTEKKGKQNRSLLNNIL